MIRNYLKIAWRNLWKNKTFTVLNTVGLSVAFAIALLLGAVAFFEMSYDKFHKNAESVYELYVTEQREKGPGISSVHPVPLAPALREEVPGITAISRYVEDDIAVSYDEKEVHFEIAYTDPAFFSIFSFPAIKGNTGTALKSRSGIAVTEKTARLLFKNENAIGKTIVLSAYGKKKPYTVAAVLQDIPGQSSLKFDMAVAFENEPDYEKIRTSWNDKNHRVYIQLHPDASALQFEKRSRDFTASHFAKDIADAGKYGIHPDANGQYIQMHLAPFSDKHFYQYQEGKIVIKRTYPHFLLALAGLIVFIACANFINMSIGSQTVRLREIGVRKILGAEKRTLFLQFWSENALVFFFSAGWGLLLGKALFPRFKTLLNTEASMSGLASPAILLVTAVIFILITFLAGGYPAYILSRNRVVTSLKGKINTTGKNYIRDAMIVVQFAIATLLIGCTLVMRSQIRFMLDKDLGFDREQVISIPINGKKDSRQIVQLLRNELASNPAIRSISAADNNLGIGRDGSVITSQYAFDHKGKHVQTHGLAVDYDYLETLGITLKSGRSFNRDIPTDSRAIVINESMAGALGEKEPLNTAVDIIDSIPYKVIGVIKDYHFEDLHYQIEPLTLFMENEAPWTYAFIKVAPGNAAGNLGFIRSAWKNIEPNSPFMGSYLDENINRTLSKERSMTTIVNSGAVIAIMLSCSGIFAIALLIISRRTKEIGIRKVVGASVPSITMLLSRDFLKLIGIAFIIITPFSWWLAKNWLQDYSYRIDLSAWFFITAGAFTAIIAFATLSVRTVKAAMANPVKNLRTE